MTASSRHRWGDPVSVLESTPSGCQETERECQFCKLVKLTIHYPDGSIPGRAWRTREGKRWEGTATPPCLPGRETGNLESLAGAPAEVPFS